MAEARRKGVEQAAVEMGACCGVGPHELDQAAPVVMVMCAVPPVVGAAPGGMVTPTSPSAEPLRGAPT